MAPAPRAPRPRSEAALARPRVATPERFKARGREADRLCVIEIAIVVFTVAALSVGGLLLPLLPAELVVLAGAGCVGVGLLLGVPTGFWYHVRLRDCLIARGELPPRWWLRPTAHHGRLRPADRPRVMPWFVAGGAGFLITVVGCVVAAAGALLQLLRAS